MTFDEWFYDRMGVGNFALRAEYFYDDLECDSTKQTKAMRMKAWLEAAFKAGQNATQNGSEHE